MRTIARVFCCVALLLVALAAASPLASVAQAAPPYATLPAATCTLVGTVRTCELWARPGTLTYASTTVAIWGYSDSPTGAAQVPGPVLVANEGETLTVVLNNNLAQPTSLSIPALDAAPDLTGVAAGGQASYTFTPAAGTYLYEAGIATNGARQVAMGLFGGLVVRPAASPATAYGAASAFDDEALLIYSAIDPALNAAPDTFAIQRFRPRTWLINGRAAGATDPIATAAGRRLLLRQINAGLVQQAPGLLGVRQTIVARDSVAETFPQTVVSETIPAGGTLDTLVAIPATAPANARYALYGTGLLIASPGSVGGLLTYITVSGTAGGTAGPTVSGAIVAPALSNGSASLAISATASAGATSAEYYIDATSGAGTPLTVSGTAISGAIPAATLATGAHSVYIRASNGATWGAFASATFRLDKTGPATSAIVLSPAATNSAQVSIQAIGSDAASGGSNVTAAEYTIDGSALTALALATSGQTVSLTGAIPAATVAGLSAGAHTVAIRSQDALGNWGALASATLTIDRAGPTASITLIAPNPNNGQIPFNTNTNGVKVMAQLTDAASTLSSAELFIDTVGATGTGILMGADSGLFNSLSQSASGLIPLPTVNNLTAGTHTIYVRGRDAAGNWGATTSSSLLIDRTAPTLTSIAASPNPTLGATSVTLTVVATDAGGAGVSGGEYWFGTANLAVGGGTTFTGLTPSIPVGALAPGSYTLRARVRDAAGNWGATVASTTLVVAPDTIFANGFETGTTPWGWTSASTNTAARLNVSAAAALVGTRGLQAQGNNTNYVQSNFGTAANPASATYDARFSFNPNNNASNGQDIFVAASGTNFTTAQTMFRVRYRRNGTQPQVQIQVGSTSNGTWVNIANNASNRIEVVWQAAGSGGPNAGTLRLFVGAATTPSQTLTTTSAAQVGAVRLGSVSGGTSNTLEYFDAFTSKRSVATLIGP